MRAVHGLPTSWEPVIATAHVESLYGAVWSPCSRFIAVAKRETVEIRDAVTLALLNTFESPSPPELTLSFSPDSRYLARFASGRCISWDLKTGGSVDVGIDLTAEPYLGLDRRDPLSVYSIDGKMFAVASPNGHSATEIITFDLPAARTHLYRVSEGRVIPPIWTCGELLRFATAEPGHITIWEVDFTLAHPPKAVESLPTPGEVANTEVAKKYLFLPTFPRLAIAFPGTLLVWDALKSNLLLKSPCPFPSQMSFSSNGYFLACLTDFGGEACVWKESLSGYILHQQLAVTSLAQFPGPSLSPDGASAISCLHSTIRLWHTNDPITSQAQLTSRPHLLRERELALGFFPNEPLAAFASRSGKTVTILDLQSGDPRLVIAVGMDVRCLGVAGNTIVVVGDKRVIVLDMVARNATAGVNDSTRMATFNLSRLSLFGKSRWGHLIAWISVSPDLSRIATSGYDRQESMGVEIHDVLTGRCLAGVALGAVEVTICS